MLTQRAVDDHCVVGRLEKSVSQQLLSACLLRCNLVYRSIFKTLFLCVDNCGDVEINRKMRFQVARWSKLKKEKRKAFLARLRRTAMALPADYINKVIGNLEAHLQLLKKADGGDFIEGGHSAAVV